MSRLTYIKRLKIEFVNAAKTASLKHKPEGNKMNNAVPAPLSDWLSQLPSQNVGTLYATIKTPFLPIYTEHKVEAWGQLCDGQDHKSMVHNMLYNRWPNRGTGYTYVSWRAVPDHPEANTYPREGKVENPQPYSGLSHSLA